MKYKYKHKNLLVSIFGIGCCPNCNSKNLTLERHIRERLIYTKTSGFDTFNIVKREYVDFDGMAKIDCRDCNWTESKNISKG